MQNRPSASCIGRRKRVASEISSGMSCSGMRLVIIGRHTSSSRQLVDPPVRKRKRRSYDQGSGCVTDDELKDDATGALPRVLLSTPRRRGCAAFARVYS